jgi:hypothetical protein
LRPRRARVLAHALIPHAGEKQDLSAAVTGGQAAMTVRRPETDEIVRGGPLENRSIVSILINVEG